MNFFLTLKKSKDRLSSDDESGNNFTSDITLDKQRLELELEYQKKVWILFEFHIFCIFFLNSIFAF